MPSRTKLYVEVVLYYLIKENCSSQELEVSLHSMEKACNEGLSNLKVVFWCRLYLIISENLRYKILYEIAKYLLSTLLSTHTVASCIQLLRQETVWAEGSPLSEKCRIVYITCFIWVQIHKSSRDEEEFQPAAFEKNYLVLCYV